MHPLMENWIKVLRFNKISTKNFFDHLHVHLHSCLARAKRCEAQNPVLINFATHNNSVPLAYDQSR